MQESRNRTTGELVFAPDGQPNMQFAGGYELRWQSIKFLESDNVVPTLDELQKFQRPGDEDGGGGAYGQSQHLGLAPTLANKTRSRLLKGDPVEVIEGDLKGIRGRVEKVEEDEVTFRPIHADLKVCHSRSQVSRGLARSPPALTAPGKEFTASVAACAAAFFTR